MSIINRLKDELELFETEAKDEIYRFLDFLRLRHAENPLPPLTFPPEGSAANPDPDPVGAGVDLAAPGADQTVETQVPAPDAPPPPPDAPAAPV